MIDTRNLILAFILSFAVLLGYQKVFVEPRLEQQQAYDAANPTSDAPVTMGDAPGLADPVVMAKEPSLTETVAADIPRVEVRTPRLTGSLPLLGAKIDDLHLADYFETLGGDDTIHLLKPHGTEGAYYADFGWAGRPSLGLILPDDNSLWVPNGDELTPETPITFTWNNGAGLIFTRTLSVDDNFMLSVEMGVENATPNTISLAPYAMLVREGAPSVSGFAILHEGPLGVFDDSLEEVSYDDLKDDGEQRFNSTGGWMGITDKYWLTALVPNQTSPTKSRLRHTVRNGEDRYQVDYLEGEYEVAAGARVAVTTHMFAGAKEVNLIEDYEEKMGIALFDRTIDWGMFYFLTKPFFHLLDFFNGLTGNFGVAILMLTVLIKLVLFPMANKSYVAMSKMKKLTPKMNAIKERYADDKMRQQQEVMALYKTEKVNPMAGCLPILVQIPVFFALYKTLFVAIEMRHQPFFGWVHDLSAPDPMTIITGFGLFPWDAPSFLMIGIWPLIMGFTMWFQQKLNPAASDPMQAKMMSFLPILFTFLLGSFPVGLVIYWTWNNILSIAQQWVIMRREGVSINDG